MDDDFEFVGRVRFIIQGKDIRCVGRKLAHMKAGTSRPTGVSEAKLGAGKETTHGRDQSSSPEPAQGIR